MKTRDFSHVPGVFPKWLRMKISEEMKAGTSQTSPTPETLGASPLLFPGKDNCSPVFRRSPSMSRAPYSPLPLTPCGDRSGLRHEVPMPTLPSADFCAALREPRDSLSPAAGTRRRPPEVSPTAFRAQPPNLRPAPLMDVDFAIICPLVRRKTPRIRFLSIGSRVCSTLLSDPTSR